MYHWRPYCFTPRQQSLVVSRWVSSASPRSLCFWWVIQWSWLGWSSTPPHPIWFSEGSCLSWSRSWIIGCMIWSRLSSLPFIHFFGCLAGRRGFICRISGYTCINCRRRDARILQGCKWQWSCSLMWFLSSRAQCGCPCTDISHIICSS